MRLQDIQYIDRPELNLSAAKGEDAAHATESVSMPFKYVKGQDGAPIMPEVGRHRVLLCIPATSLTSLLQGMITLLARDADKGILDLL